MINNIYPAKTEIKAEQKEGKVISTRHDRVIVAQVFDKDKIFLEQNGQKFNLDEYIQKQREDTEIYEVMRKYGNNEDLASEIMNNARKPIYADIGNAPKDLREYIKTCNETAEKIEELKAMQIEEQKQQAIKIAEEKEKEIIEKAIPQKIETEEKK